MLVVDMVYETPCIVTIIIQLSKSLTVFHSVPDSRDHSFVELLFFGSFSICVYPTISSDACPCSLAKYKSCLFV
jgi:hypothetical protein